MLSIFKLSSKNGVLTELLLTLLFSTLSLSLGFLYNADQGVADFRESPLLILIFYLKNPLFIILSSLITSFANYGSYITTFSMHFVGLFAAWFFVRWLKTQSFSRVNRGISWMGFIVVYYGVFVIPTWITVRCGILGMPILPEASMLSMGLTSDSNFFQLHGALFNSAKYEVITTMSVTGLYLMELESRRILVKNNHSLEKLVTKRTEELAIANGLLTKLNKNLILKNNEIKSINVNLDELAKERSKKIQLQMQALSKYAQVNSHEVRAPLARILSIAKQLEDVSDMSVKEELVSSVRKSADELDKVIRKVNRILTS